MIMRINLVTVVSMVMVVVVISSVFDSVDDFPDQENNAKAQDDPGDGKEYRVTDQPGRGRRRHWRGDKGTFQYICFHCRSTDNECSQLLTKKYSKNIC